MRDLDRGEFFLRLSEASPCREFVYHFFPDLRSSGGGKRGGRRYRTASVLLFGCLRSLDLLSHGGVAGVCLFRSSNRAFKRFNGGVRRERRLSPVALRGFLADLEERGLVRWRKGYRFKGKKGEPSRVEVTAKFRDEAAYHFALRGETLGEGLVRLLSRPRPAEKVEPVIVGNPSVPRSAYQHLEPLVDAVRRSFIGHEVVLRIPHDEWLAPAHPERTLAEFIRWRCLGISLHPEASFRTKAGTDDHLADITHLFGGLHRVFTWGLDETGRFYCPAQEVPSTLRRFLLVDGEPVADLDYKACHPTLIYHAFLGVVAPPDIYERPAALLGFNNAREAVKQGILVLLNAKTRREAEGALAEKFLTSPKEQWLPLRREMSLADGAPPTRAKALEVAGRVLDAIVEALPEMRPFFFKGVGNRLQRLDAALLEVVLPACLKAGIWTLPLHDGLLVPQSRAKEAMTLMWEGYREVFGFTTTVTAKAYSGDEALEAALSRHSKELQSGAAPLIAQTTTPQVILETPTSSRSSTISTAL